MPSMVDRHYVQIDVKRPIEMGRENIERTRDLIALTLFWNGASSRRIARILGCSHADVLKALAFCFKLVNTNAHDDPAAARHILSELERMR